MEELFFATTHKGLENSLKKEIKEFFNVDIECIEEGCFFKTKDYKNLFRFLLLNQSAKDLMLVCGYENFSEDFIKQINKKMFELKKDDFLHEFLSGLNTFEARLSHDSNDVSSSSVEPDLGGIIIDNLGLKVDLEDPDIRFKVWIHNKKLVFGFELNKKDMSKRDYRLMNSSRSIKANIAYHVIRILDFKEKEVLLVADANTGEIPIEAALFLSGMKNHYSNFKDIIFYKLKFFEGIDKTIKTKKINKSIYAFTNNIKELQYCKSNAKIAGVLDFIVFSKTELDWLDARFEKESVDKFAMFIESPSRNVNEKTCVKEYKELFYQLSYVLKKTGLACVLIQKPELFRNILNDSGFVIVEDNEIIIGDNRLYCILFKRV